MSEVENDLPEWAQIVTQQAHDILAVAVEMTGKPMFGKSSCSSEFCKERKNDETKPADLVFLSYLLIDTAGKQFKRGEIDAQKFSEFMLGSAMLVGECKQQLWDNPAVSLARKRHADNYSMIEEALDYWRKNIDPSLSASKAAEQLLRVVPLSHKKLAEVVSKEKKKPS